MKTLDDLINTIREVLSNPDSTPIEEDRSTRASAVNNQEDRSTQPPVVDNQGGGYAAPSWEDAWRRHQQESAERQQEPQPTQGQPHYNLYPGNGVRGPVAPSNVPSTTFPNLGDLLGQIGGAVDQNLGNIGGAIDQSLGNIGAGIDRSVNNYNYRNAIPNDLTGAALQIGFDALKSALRGTGAVPGASGSAGNVLGDTLENMAWNARIQLPATEQFLFGTPPANDEDRATRAGLTSPTVQPPPLNLPQFSWPTFGSGAPANQPTEPVPQAPVAPTSAPVAPTVTTPSNGSRVKDDTSAQTYSDGSSTRARYESLMNQYGLVQLNDIDWANLANNPSKLVELNNRLDEVERTGTSTRATTPTTSGGSEANWGTYARMVASRQLGEEDGYAKARQAGFTGSFNDFLVEKDRLIHQSRGGGGGGGTPSGGYTAPNVATTVSATTGELNWGDLNMTPEYEQTLDRVMQAAGYTRVGRKQYRGGAIPITDLLLNSITSNPAMAAYFRNLFLQQNVWKDTTAGV